MSLTDRKKIKKVMEDLGFTQDVSRHFIHPRSKFFVEFPGSAMTIGESLVSKFNEITLKTGVLKLLTPTDCVKDRLAAFYHWNDRQGLDQAIWVCEAQTVNIAEVERWSELEHKLPQFKEFKTSLKKLRKKKITPV